MGVNFSSACPGSLPFWTRLAIATSFPTWCMEQCKQMLRSWWLTSAISRLVQWIFPLQVFPLQTTSCSFWLIRKQVATMFVVVFGSIQTRPKSSNPEVGTPTFHGACKFQPQLCWTLMWTLRTRPALTVEDKPRSTCSWLGCQDVLLGPALAFGSDVKRIFGN